MGMVQVALMFVEMLRDSYTSRVTSILSNHFFKQCQLDTCHNFFDCNRLGLKDTLKAFDSFRNKLQKCMN